MRNLQEPQEIIMEWIRVVNSRIVLQPTQQINRKQIDSRKILTILFR